MSFEARNPFESVRNTWSKLSGSLESVQDHPFLWLAPALVFLLVFRFYPLLEVIRMSFTKMSLVQPNWQYVGFETYIEVITSQAFATMVRVTVIFVISSVILQLSLGLLLALAIDHGVKKHLYGSVATRVAVLSAWVIPGIVIGILWSILLIGARYGVVNYVLVQFGFDVMSFLSDPQLALVSVIIANTWRGTAFSMIILYAGLQTVPQHLYDAARVDGAKILSRFRYVTIPQIKPVIFINLVLITIYTVNTFDMIMSLTGGGPGRATEVLALHMYYLGFTQFQLGKAAAVAVLMLLVNVAMTLIYSRVLVDEEVM